MWPFVVYFLIDIYQVQSGHHQETAIKPEGKVPRVLTSWNIGCSMHVLKKVVYDIDDTILLKCRPL
jgi:hypothetical protein